MKILNENLGQISFSDLAKKFKEIKVESVTMYDKFNKFIASGYEFKKIKITSSNIWFIGFMEKFELNIDKINIKSIDLMDEGGEYIKITTKSLNTIDIHFLVYNY